MRFTATASGGSASYSINDGKTAVSSLQGVYTISGSGTVEAYGAGDAYVVTSKGTAKLGGASGADSFTFTGSGWGHNVGMSQWGATAMAELGHDYQEILEFYFTGVTIE